MILNRFNVWSAWLSEKRHRNSPIHEKGKKEEWDDYKLLAQWFVGFWRTALAVIGQWHSTCSKETSTLVNLLRKNLYAILPRCSLFSGVIIFKTWNYYAMKWSNLAGNFQLGLNITVYKWKAVVSLINNPQQRWKDYFFLQQLVVAIDWLWKAANIKDKKKTAAVYVGSSITVHNPWFFVHKWKRNKLMPRFYWSIRPK